MLWACPVCKLISHSMPTQGHADGVGRAGRAREWVATHVDTSRNAPPKGTLTGLGVPAGRASGWPPRWTPRATPHPRAR